MNDYRGHHRVLHRDHDYVCMYHRKNALVDMHGVVVGVEEGSFYSMVALVGTAVYLPPIMVVPLVAWAEGEDVVFVSMHHYVLLLPSFGAPSSLTPFVAVSR